MNMFSKNERRIKGFTLIELLVVIAIIGLLSTLAIVALGTVRVKARDARRVADMEAIFTALNMYLDDRGCLPITGGFTTCPGAAGYNESNAGGWDYSSQGDFLPFLVSGGYMSKVPVDPVNDTTGDATPAGSSAYRYFCYNGQAGVRGLVLMYHRESDNQWVFKTDVTSSTNPADATYLCK